MALAGAVGAEHRHPLAVADLGVEGIGEAVQLELLADHDRACPCDRRRGASSPPGRAPSPGAGPPRSARSWSSWPAPGTRTLSLPIDARRRYSTRAACISLRSSCQRRCSSSMRARRASRASCQVAKRPAVHPRGAPSEGDDPLGHRGEELAVVADEEDRLRAGPQRRPPATPCRGRRGSCRARRAAARRRRSAAAPRGRGASARRPRGWTAVGRPPRVERLAARRSCSRCPRAPRRPSRRRRPMRCGPGPAPCPVRSPGSRCAAASARGQVGRRLLQPLGRQVEEHVPHRAALLPPADQLPHHAAAGRRRARCPRRGAWSPAMTRNRVVLPAPLAPTRATCSPSPTPKLDASEQLDAAGCAARHPVHVDRAHGRDDATDDLGHVPDDGFPSTVPAMRAVVQRVHRASVTRRRRGRSARSARGCACSSA